MGRKVKDLTNQKFGKLTVVNLLPTRAKNGGTLWRCRCDCGEWVPCVRCGNLTHGNTTSCGCEQRRLASERLTKRSTTHGLSNKAGNSHHTRWASMKTRTTNQNTPNYHNYGGRGIKMYPGWFNSFVSFKAWLDENLGPCPDGCTLDRIDNDSGYRPGNLRWATAKTQRRNQR